MKIEFNKQQGFLSVIVVALIVIISFLGLAITYMLVSSAASTNNFQQGERALFLAEAGLEHATHGLLGFTIANRVSCSGLSIANTISPGAYSVSSTGPFYVSSPTTLSGALTATATTIPVVSTANYQSAGRIMIDKELIDYTSTDSTDFLGVTRGVDGSVATTHVTGTKVGQYQCQLNSEGALPTVASAIFARTLQEDIQLQEAWTVGNAVSAKMHFIRWNNPTERTWTDSLINGSVNLFGISMLSYVDGWAVGANATFYRWNGSTWASVASGLPGSYNSVYCIASNNCIVVGPSRHIGQWNGSAWSQVTPTGSLGATTLTSVHCADSANCWAVGSNASGGKFYNGTGSPTMSWVGIDESGLSVLSGGGTFNGVFCNSVNDCWAVGTTNVFGRKATASTTWTNFSTGLTNVSYNGIYCNNTSDCWAVGNASGNDVIAHWNGTAWALDTSNPTPTANLNSVACSQPNDCWAVGVTTSGTNTAFVHWNGTTWSTVTPASMPATTLNSVAMVSGDSQPWSVWQEIYA